MDPATSTTFTPGASRHGESLLLALPNEMKDKIACLALQPHRYYEFGYRGPLFQGVHEPRVEFLKRLKPFLANRELYHAAIEAYFLGTRLNAVFGKDASKEAEAKDPDLDSDDEDNVGREEYHGEVVFGTFEEHQFFLDNTVKIRVELEEGYDAGMVTKVTDILSACKAITDVRICIGNLTMPQAMAFRHAVILAMDPVKQLSGRNIIVAFETKHQYQVEMALRAEAEAEYERLEE